MSSKNLKSMLFVGIAVTGLAVSQLACSDPNYNGNTDRQIVNIVATAAPELKQGVDKAVEKVKQNVEDTGALVTEAYCKDHVSDPACP